MAWITVKKHFDYKPTPRSMLSFSPSDKPVNTVQAAADHGVKIGAAEHYKTPNKDEAKVIKADNG